MKGVGIGVKGNDIEAAVRLFRRKVRRDGVLIENERREQNPNQGERKKAKGRRATARKKKRGK
ncbi:MAG: 30S ribosomal protein S21 [Pseudomonadota bacterium]